MRRPGWTVQGFALLFVLVALGAFPSSAEKGTSEDSISRQQADAILEELRSIRKLIVSVAAGNRGRALDEGEPGAVTKKLKLDDLPILGSRNARVTIAEFFDYQCPFCRDFHLSTLETIRNTYIGNARSSVESIDPRVIHSTTPFST